MGEGEGEEAKTKILCAQMNETILTKKFEMEPAWGNEARYTETSYKLAETYLEYSEISFGYTKQSLRYSKTSSEYKTQNK